MSMTVVLIRNSDNHGAKIAMWGEKQNLSDVASQKPINIAGKHQELEDGYGTDPISESSGSNSANTWILNF